MKRILLVEDDEDCQAIYRLILEDAGFDVLHCGEGRAAIRLARESVPDLILMDVVIPGIDGFEVTRILKADRRTGTIPVFGVTARIIPDYEKRASESGFDMYRHKPLALEELLAQVQALVRTT